MRILALADVHLDYYNRFNDFIKSLKQISTYAINNNVGMVIVLGDVYQRRRPYSIEKFEFEKWVKSLIDNNVEIIIIPGLKGMHEFEHDVSTISEFEALKIDGVTILPNESIITIHNSYKIFLGHLMLKEAKLGALGYGVGSDAISVEELIDRYPANLYLLGHIHKAQLVKKNPPVLYAGSIDRVTFGERNEVKGFIDINIDSTVKYKFIRLKTRKMVKINIDKQWIELGKPSFEVKDAIVQAIIKCKREEINLFRDPEIRHALATANLVKDISFEIENVETAKNEDINSKISPLKAFIEYARQERLSEEVINLGKQIIGETK
jgi:DNA repair exonuclease SbcCD nuclease subunit